MDDPTPTTPRSDHLSPPTHRQHSKPAAAGKKGGAANKTSRTTGKEKLKEAAGTLSHDHHTTTDSASAAAAAASPAAADGFAGPSSNKNSNSAAATTAATSQQTRPKKTPTTTTDSPPDNPNPSGQTATTATAHSSKDAAAPNHPHHPTTSTRPPPPQQGGGGGAQSTHHPLRAPPHPAPRGGGLTTDTTTTSTTTAIRHEPAGNATSTAGGMSSGGGGGGRGSTGAIAGASGSDPHSHHHHNSNTKTSGSRNHYSTTATANATAANTSRLATGPAVDASSSPSSSSPAYMLSAEAWRAQEDVPTWRRHGMDSSVNPGGMGGGDGRDGRARPSGPNEKGGGEAGEGGGAGKGTGAPEGISNNSNNSGGGGNAEEVGVAESSSYYEAEDDASSSSLSVRRKFTRKGESRNNFGSSTTLSSATEASDDNGDGNFHVALRVRPLSSQEKQRRDQFAATFPGDGQCAVDNNGSQRHFQFNVVFEPDAAQEDVFENCGIRRLVDTAVMGYTCTAFAFGQTGSGKTHTMTGPPSQFHQVGVTPDPKMYGIIQRSFKYLFQQVKQQGGGKVIRASYLEIYNEQVIDLLNNSHRRYLSVRWSKNKGFYVENLFTVECETLDDLMAVLEEGLRNRQTGSHGLNEFSSRSHSVLTITIDSETQPDTEDENLYVTKRGKLSFVDLAGSEKVKDASGGTWGPGMLESNSINKSLLVLGNCISHLGDAKRRQGHIPYRDSKLTKLLSDSLGGNGITLMIACITPSSINITETMNTLRYASRAKKIKSKPTVKMDPRENLIVNLKREIKVLRNENHYLRQQLDFPAKPKGQLQKENDEKFMKFMKEQKQKESGLYEMLQEYMVENENLRAENSEMHSMRDRIRREQQLLYRENEKLMKRMEEMERVMSQNPAMWSQQQHPRRTDGYGQYDLLSPRTSPVATHPPPPGYHSGHKHPPPAHGGFGSPPGSRGGKGGNPPGPMKPPHRLPDPVIRPAQRPVEVVENGAVYVAANNGYASPRGGMPRQTSPTRTVDRRASQLSTTDAIHSMNEQLKREVQQLEGQIRQHHHGHDTRPTDLARSNGSNSVR